MLGAEICPEPFPKVAQDWHPALARDMNFHNIVRSLHINKEGLSADFLKHGEHAIGRIELIRVERPQIVNIS